MGIDGIEIEVVCATTAAQWVRALRVAPGATVADAVRASGVLAAHPDLDPDALSVGIYGRPCAPEALVRSGDRIEIYRPLKVDPKELRRRRAAEAKPG